MHRFIKTCCSCVASPVTCSSEACSLICNRAVRGSIERNKVTESSTNSAKE